MARRHTTGFDVLGMSDDPTPGDPDEIRRLAEHYQGIADEARTAAEILGEGGAVERGKGEAMDSLREKLDSLPEKLGQTRDSFEAAAAAYKTYAAQLEEAQAQTDRAMDQAGPVAATAAQTVPTLAPDATDAQRDAARRRQDGIDAAKQTLSAARSLAEQARNLREQAARRAGEELDEAAAKAIPERNFFQKLADFFADFPFVQIILGILVAVTALFFPAVGFVLGAGLFILQTALQAATGNFKLGDFLAGLLVLVPGGALLRLGGKVGTAIGSKLGPLFGTGARGFFQKVGGSITNAKNAFTNSKPVTVAFQSPGGRLITDTATDFGRRAAEDAAVKGLNGEQVTPADILAGAAVGAAAGGAFRGIQSARKGEFSGGAFVPVKGDAPAPGTAGSGNTSDPEPDSGVAPAAGGAVGGVQSARSGESSGGASVPVKGNPPAPGTARPGNASDPEPDSGVAPAAGNPSDSELKSELKKDGIALGMGLIPDGAIAEVGKTITEGINPKDEASNDESTIPTKGTAPGDGSAGLSGAGGEPGSAVGGQASTGTGPGPSGASSAGLGAQPVPPAGGQPSTSTTGSQPGGASSAGPASQPSESSTLTTPNTAAFTPSASPAAKSPASEPSIGSDPEPPSSTP